MNTAPNTTTTKSVIRARSPLSIPGIRELERSSDTESERPHREKDSQKSAPRDHAGPESCLHFFVVLSVLMADGFLGNKPDVRDDDKAAGIN